MNETNHTHQRGTQLKGAFFFLVAAVCIVGFYDIQHWYGQFKLPYGVGTYTIPIPELLFYLWYGLLGSLAVFCLIPVLLQTKLPDLSLNAGEWLQQRTTAFLWLGAIFVFMAALAIRYIVFFDSPITDDESTYLFVAQTLLQGKVTLPLPADPEFFRNQFVHINAQGWYGKYPIGHPALLAIGEALGARILVVPLLGACSFALTYQIGRRIFSPAIALLAASLLCLSPQFLYTHATQLSQPASGCFLLLGIWTVLELRETQHPKWALASGCAWAACLLIRPLPGVLFLPVIAAFALKLPWPNASKFRAFAIALLPVAIAITSLFVINRAQNGSWTGNRYQQSYNASKKIKKRQSKRSRRQYIASSWASASLRQLFWLLGCPLALILLCFAHFSSPTRYHDMLLVYGSLFAIYLYRFLFPKTVVAATGPIYVSEAVPLLCLLVAAGIFRLHAHIQHTTVGGRGIIALTIAMMAINIAIFIPFQTDNLSRAGFAWQRPLKKLQTLQKQRKKKLLVFANAMTFYPARDTWAYFPPNPHPSRKDAILFVRRMRGKNGPQRNYRFWKRQFPQHIPVLLLFDARGLPYLHIPSKPSQF